MIKDGALSMEMDGHILTLKWPADNLDTLLQVVKVNSDEKGCIDLICPLGRFQQRNYLSRTV